MQAKGCEFDSHQFHHICSVNSTGRVPALQAGSERLLEVRVLYRVPKYPHGVMVARQSPKLLVWVQILVWVPLMQVSYNGSTRPCQGRDASSILVTCSTQGGCWFPNKAHNLVYVSSILTPATNMAEKHDCYEGFIHLSDWV